MNKKIIWIGPIVKNEDLMISKAISPAANVWQLGFIGGLIDNEYEVISISYVPRASWPNDSIWCKKHAALSKSALFKQHAISYLNIKFIREFWMAIAMLKMMVSKLSKKNEYIIITYNPLKRHSLLANWAKLFFKSTWISIVADDIAKGEPDYTLFLSYDYYKRFSSPNKLFCDGGITVRNNGAHHINKESQKSLIYAGSLNKWTGIKDFIKLFSNVVSDEFILNIYGKGNEKEIQDAIKKTGSKNIILHGFVEDDVLEKACLNAYAFVNPRATNIQNSENNFPSKLLYYLSFKKPIISTKSKGISNLFDELLFYFSDSDSLKIQLNKVKNGDVYNEYTNRIDSFTKEFTWKNKVKSLLSNLN